MFVTSFNDGIKLEHFIKSLKRDCVHAKSTAIISSLIPSECRVRADFEPRKMILLIKFEQVNHSWKIVKQKRVNIGGWTKEVGVRAELSGTLVCA